MLIIIHTFGEDLATFFLRKGNDHRTFMDYRMVPSYCVTIIALVVVVVSSTVLAAPNNRLHKREIPESDELQHTDHLGHTSDFHKDHVHHHIHPVHKRSDLNGTEPAEGNIDTETEEEEEAQPDQEPPPPMNAPDAPESNPEPNPPPIANVIDTESKERETRPPPSHNIPPPPTHATTTSTNNVEHESGGTSPKQGSVMGNGGVFVPTRTGTAATHLPLPVTINHANPTAAPTHAPPTNHGIPTAIPTGQQHFQPPPPSEYPTTKFGGGGATHPYAPTSSSPPEHNTPPPQHDKTVTDQVTILTVKIKSKPPQQNPSSGRNGNEAVVNPYFTIISPPTHPTKPEVVGASYSTTGNKCPSIKDFLKGSENFWVALKHAAGWKDGLALMKDAASNSVTALAHCLQQLGSGISAHFGISSPYPPPPPPEYIPTPPPPTSHPPAVFTTTTTIHPILQGVLMKEAGVGPEDLQSLVAQPQPPPNSPQVEHVAPNVGGNNANVRPSFPPTLPPLPDVVVVEPLPLTLDQSTYKGSTLSAQETNSLSKYAEAERTKLKESETHIALENNNAQDPNKVTGVKVSKSVFVTSKESKYNDMVLDTTTSVEKDKLKETSLSGPPELLLENNNSVAGENTSSNKKSHEGGGGGNTDTTAPKSSDLATIAQIFKLLNSSDTIRKLASSSAPPNNNVLSMPITSASSLALSNSPVSYNNEQATVNVNKNNKVQNVNVFGDMISVNPKTVKNPIVIGAVSTKGVNPDTKITSGPVVVSSSPPRRKEEEPKGAVEKQWVKMTTTPVVVPKKPVKKMKGEQESRPKEEESRMSGEVVVSSPNPTHATTAPQPQPQESSSSGEGVVSSPSNPTHPTPQQVGSGEDNQQPGGVATGSSQDLLEVEGGNAEDNKITDSIIQTPKISHVSAPIEHESPK